NTQPIGFDAPFLLSRLTLVFVGLGSVAAGGYRFAQTLRHSGKVKKVKGTPAPAAASTASPSASLTLAELGMHSGAAGFWQTVRQVARSEMRELRSQPGLYLFVPLILFQTVASSLVSLGAFDTPLLSLLLIFYAVESMERERVTGFSAIANALPIRTSALVTGKVIALSAIGVVIGVACLI